MKDLVFILIAYILPSGFCGFVFGLAAGLYHCRVK